MLQAYVCEVVKAEGAVDDRSEEPRKHIVAINGSPAFLSIIHELFQDEDYNVTATNFVPASFDQIVALQPNALIVDVTVGRKVGWDLLHRLHADAATTGIPTLVVSTDPRLLTLARVQAAQYATHRYLEKPFDMDVVLTQIREMIGEA